MDKIVDRLYLGNLKGASDMQALHKAGITHILQVASGIRPFFPKDFKYKVINVTDTSQSSLIRHFPAAVQFIKEGISKGGVLVHCYAGVSRSASCVIAFLMQEKDMTFTEAFAFASKRRPIIFPNMGFQRQLCEYEKLLHLHKSYSSPTRVNKLAAKVNLGSGGNSSSSIQRPPPNGGLASMNATVANFTGQAGLVGKGGANKEIVKQIHRSLLQGIPSTNHKMFSADSSAQDFLFDQEVPQSDEFQRVTYFDRSNAFGFSEDKLGRLAEINKAQLDSALKDLTSFRRTDQGFNRQPYIRGGVANKEANKISKASFSRVSPNKPDNNKDRRTDNTGMLRLEKQAVSAENMWDTQANGKKSTIHKMHVKSPEHRKTKNDVFNDYCQNDGTNGIKTQSGRPKTNQSARKPFGQPTGSFDNSHTNTIRIDSNVYAAPSIGSGTGSFLQISSEDLNKKQLGKGIPDSPSNKKKVNQELFNTIQNSSGRLLYVCIGCNTPLFTSKDIVDHTTTATTSSSTVNRANLNQCTNYYVKQREWMNNLEGNSSSTTNLKKTAGTLLCYRKVCRKKLGNYSLQGLRCNCGHYVKPAFQINKNRVKPVNTTSPNINILSTNKTNHASNSDLSKYSTGVDPFASQNTAPSVLFSPDIQTVHITGESIGINAPKHPGGSSSVVESGQNEMYYQSMFKKSTEKLFNVNQGLQMINGPIGQVRNHHSSFPPHKDGTITGITIGSQLSSKYQKRNAMDFANNQFVPPSQLQTQIAGNSLISQDPFSSFSKVFITGANGKVSPFNNNKVEFPAITDPMRYKFVKSVQRQFKTRNAGSPLQGHGGRTQQAAQNSADATFNKNHGTLLKTTDVNWHKQHVPSKSYAKANAPNAIVINANNNQNAKGLKVSKFQNLSFAGVSNKSHASADNTANSAIYFNKGNQSSYSHNVSAPTAEGTQIQISGGPSHRSKGQGSINVTSFSTNYQPSVPLHARKSDHTMRKGVDRKLKFK